MIERKLRVKLFTNKVIVADMYEVQEEGKYLKVRVQGKAYKLKHDAIKGIELI